MEEAEEWRAVLDGYYEVSSLGRVRRARPAPGTTVGKLIILHLNQHGYYDFTASTGGPRRSHRVHTLVATAFLGPIPEGKCGVNHINGVKTDNRPSNLEWADAFEQMGHASKMNLVAYGMRTGGAKLTDDAVVDIRNRVAAVVDKGQLAIRLTIETLADEYGVCYATAYFAATGYNHKRSGGPLLKTRKYKPRASKRV